MQKILVALALLAQQAAAHVTMVPNYGAAAGNYFSFDVKIPHGTPGKDTTKIEIAVPHGVLSAVPEAVYGWDITTTTRSITPYTSHGVTVSTAPATIVYTAKCENAGGTSTPNGATCSNTDHGGLDNEHLMLLTMQIKLGCDFGVTAGDASVWMEQHTLWWPVKQWISTYGTNDGNSLAAGKDWSETYAGNAGWGAGPMGTQPSPYLFIYSDAKCKLPDSTGSTDQLGMRWGATSDIIPPVADQDPIKTKAEVLSMMNEHNLDLEEMIATQDKRINDIETDKLEIKHCAIVALCVACILMVAFLTLCIFRVSKPQHFREYLLSTPLIQEGKTVEMGSV